MTPRGVPMTNSQRILVLTAGLLGLAFYYFL